MSEPLEGPALELVAILFVIAAGSSLSALEAATAAFGEVRLLAAKEEGGRYGATAARLLRDLEDLPVRFLTGRTVALVVSVALAVHVAHFFDAWWATVLAVAGVGLLYAGLSVGVGALARARASTWALPMARWLRPVELVLAVPLSAPLGALVRFLDRAFPAPPAPSSDEHAVREVEHMIEQREESGSLPEEFAELLLSVLEFKDTVARAVMVPRTQMKAIEIQTSIEDALEMIVAEGHSRYPVYRERVDQIEGILYAKDLFRILKDGDPSEHSLDRIIRRPVFFVAETHKIGQLLREMQSRRFHLAVLVDEFGGTSGIVTLEDILEEIVGEIQDEHDTEEPTIQRLGKEHFLVDASVSVYDLSEVLGIELEAEGDFDSVGGLVVEEAGRVPMPGESVAAHGFEFLVREADERHVTQVEVTRAEETPVAVAG